MTVIAAFSAKGSPGVTTFSTVLAAVWPTPALLAECDASGGDLAYRLNAAGGAPLSLRRGLLSLAAAEVHAPLELTEHIQQIDGGLDVLVGVAGHPQARAIGDRWEHVAEALAASPVDVIADCGQLDPDSPALRVVGRADFPVVVVRAEPDSIAHARSIVEWLPLSRPIAAVVVTADITGRAVREVRQALDGSTTVDVLGTVALDERAAAGLRGAWGRKLDRTRLVASVRDVAAVLHSRTGAPVGPEGSAL